MREKMRSALIVALGVTIFGAHARAEVWFYVDQQGGEHYRLVRPPGAEGKLYHPLVKIDRRGWRTSGPVTECGQSRVDRRRVKDHSPERFRRYDGFIKEAAENIGVEEELIRAVIMAESRFDPGVVSCRGAKGLMQIMPFEEPELLISNIFDPRQNIGGGTKMLKRYDYEFQGNKELMVAAHNAGIYAVKAAGNRIPVGRVYVGGKWRDYGNGVAKYVETVMRWYRLFKQYGPDAPVIYGRRKTN